MWSSLGDLIRKKSFKFTFEDGEIPLNLQKAVQEINPNLAQYIEYKDIKKDTLYIKVSDNLIISELEAHKHKIKAYLNKERTKPINNIRLTLS